MRLRIYKWNGTWELWRVSEPQPGAREERYLASSPDWRVLMSLATRDPAYLSYSYISAWS